MYFDPLTVAIVLGISSILLIGASFYSVFIFFRGIQLAPLFEKERDFLQTSPVVRILSITWR